LCFEVFSQNSDLKDINPSMVQIKHKLLKKIELTVAEKKLLREKEKEYNQYINSKEFQLLSNSIYAYLSNPESFELESRQ